MKSTGRPLSGLSRLFEAGLTLAGLVVLTFLLMKILPGSPFDEETLLHPAVRAQLEKDWALDQGPVAQFTAYVGSLLRGDLGMSFAEQRPVSQILREGLFATLLLNVLALVVIFSVGILTAVLAAVRPGGAVERAVDTLTIAMISLPSLFLGPLLIWVFALHFDWLPVAFLETPSSYILPVLTLAMRPTAYLIRILGAALREARGADYMRTAKAKGLSPVRALIRHALRNSLMPLLSYCGPLIVGLLSGSFMVEVLFAVNGLGSAFVDAISNRDLPVILGVTLFYGVMLIAVSMVLDVVMRAVDPRLKGDR